MAVEGQREVPTTFYGLERKSHTSSHQSFQSMHGLLSRSAGMFGELGIDKKR